MFEKYALEETGGGGEARNEEERENKNGRTQGEIEEGRRERRMEEEEEWKEGANRRRNERIVLGDRFIGMNGWCLKILKRWRSERVMETDECRKMSSLLIPQGAAG